MNAIVQLHPRKKMGLALLLQTQEVLGKAQTLPFEFKMNHSYGASSSTGFYLSPTLTEGAYACSKKLELPMFLQSIQTMNLTLWLKENNERFYESNP